MVDNTLGPSQSMVVTTTAFKVLTGLANIARDLSPHWTPIRDRYDSCTVDRLAFTKAELEVMSMTCDEAGRRLGADGVEQAIRDAVVRVRDIATVTQGTNPRTVFGRVRRGTATIPGGGYADENMVKAVRLTAAGIPSGPADVVAVEVVRRAFLPAGSFPSSPALSKPVPPETEEGIASDAHIPSSTTPTPDASQPTRSHVAQPESSHGLPPSHAACDEEAIRIELDRCLDELYPDPEDRQACKEGVFGQSFDRLVEYAGLLRLEPDDEGWGLQRRCRARMAIAAELTMFEVSNHSPSLASMLMPHVNRLLDLIDAERMCSGLDPQEIIERTSTLAASDRRGP